MVYRTRQKLVNNVTEPANNKASQSNVNGPEVEAHPDQETGHPPALPLFHILLLLVLLAALLPALFYMGGNNPPVNLPPNNNNAAGGETATMGNTKTTSEDTVTIGASGPVRPDAKPDTSTRPESPGASTSSSPEEPTSGGEVTNTDAEAGLQPESASEPSTPVSEYNLQQKAGAIAAYRRAKVDGPTRDEQMVMSWPGEKYTLQVMAAGQPENLKKFVAAQPNRDQLKLVGIPHSDKPWFVVLTGVYSDYALARKALQLLPQAQVNAGPWVRKISDIQQKFIGLAGN